MADRDQYHHGNLREALVDAASCLISESGTAGLSLRKVARQAGVSQAAPYHHFSSKDILLAEVARRGFDDLTQRLRDASTGAPIERVEQMGRAYIGFALENPWLYLLMFGAELSPTEVDHPALKQSGGCAFSVLVDAVAHGQAEAVFAGTDPGPPSIAIWSAMHGLVSILLSKMGVAAEECQEPTELGGVEMDPDAMVRATIGFCVAGLVHGIGST
jgi:AcrR family transcriptional regulator